MGEVEDPAELPHPPGPPELPRRLRLYRAQWIALPVLFLIPVLALFNVFGEAREVARGTAGEIELEVDSPIRLRRGLRSDIEIRVTNASAGLLDNGALVVRGAYLGGFANISFIPSPSQPYQVDLPALAPGESTLVRIELEAREPWRHRGEIVVVLGDGSDTARVPLATFVFP